MPSVREDTTIREFQEFIKEVYGLPNDRHFAAWDMLMNVERFLMRGLKGIRKQNQEKAKTNLMISLSWLMSFLNQFHVDIEDELWRRFPYKCSYCGSRPCSCKEKRVEKRQAVQAEEHMRPKTLAEFQEMFNQIYPAASRSVEHAGIHLAEEMGELSEAVLAYRANREQGSFESVALEAADLVSCFMGVFNSLPMNAARELAHFYRENCHKCHHAPCQCSFIEIINFKS